jgi:hypothetical protein
MEIEQAKLLEHEWKRVLDEHSLPFFYMNECNAAGGVFKKAGLSMDQCGEVARRMIGIIKRRARVGFAITLNPKSWDEILGPNEFGGPYGWAIRTCFNAAKERADHWAVNEGWSGKIAYVFEAGHKSQVTAERIIQSEFLTESMRKRYHYSSHSFVGKRDSCGVQAADLLAWQWYKDRMRDGTSRPMRRDLASLLEAPHRAMHWTEDNMRDLVELRRHMGMSNASSQEEADAVVDEWYSRNK